MESKVTKNNPLFNDDILLPPRSNRRVTTSVEMVSNNKKKNEWNKGYISFFGVCVIGICVCALLVSGFASKEHQSSKNVFAQNLMNNRTVSLKTLPGMDSDTIETCFGTTNLTVHACATVGNQVIANGTTQVHDLTTNFTAIVHSDDDVVIENEPVATYWNVNHLKLDLDEYNGWESSKPIFILSTSDKNHTVVHPNNEGVTIPLKKGLNSIHNLSVNENKHLSMLFGADKTVNNDERLLKDEDITVKIFGALKPVINLTSSVHVDPISLGSGLVLTNSTFTVSNIGSTFPEYSLDSQLTISSSIMDKDIYLNVKGDLNDHAFKITGTLDNLEFGNGDEKISVSSVRVTIKGIRDVDDKITVSGKLIGTVTFDERFSTSFNLNLPISASEADESVSFSLSDINIDNYLTVAALKGVITNSSPYLTLGGTAEIDTKAANVELDVQATFKENGVSFTGKLDHWILDIGNKGFDMNDITLVMDKDEKDSFSCDLRGQFTFFGVKADGHLSFHPDTSPIMELSIDNTSHVSGSDLASHFTDVPSSDESSQTFRSVYDKLIHSDLSLETINMILNLEARTFVASGLTDISDEITNVGFRLEVDSINNYFSVGVSINKEFQLSDIISEVGSLDDYTLKSGSFVFANHDTSFQIGSKTINCVNGIVFSGEMDLPRTSSSIQNPEVEISGTFEANSNDLNFTGKLAHYQLTHDILVKSGVVSLSTSAPYLSLNTTNLLTIGSKSVKFASILEYSIDPNTYEHNIALTGHVDEIQLGANKNVDLKNVSFSLSDSGNGFKGQIAGTVVVGSVSLQTELDYPLTHAASLNLHVPNIRLTDTALLKEVTVDASTSSLDFNAIFVDVLSIQENIKVPVSGSFTSDSFSMNGALSSWSISSTGVKASNVTLSMNGELDANNRPTNVEGSIAMELNVFGADVSGSLEYPRSGSHIQLAVNDFKIGDEMTIGGSLDLVFDSNGEALMLKLDGSMDLALSINQHTVLDAEGYYHNDGSFNVSAQAKEIHLGDVAGSNLVLSEIDFNIKHESDNEVSYSGSLDAKMALGDVLLNVELDYPLQNAEVDLKIPTVRLTDHAVLSNVDLSFEENSNSLQLSGSLDLSFDQSSKLNDLNLDVSGSIIEDKVTLTGSVGQWELPVGHNGASVSDLSVTVETTMRDSQAHSKVALKGTVNYDSYYLMLNGEFDSNTDVVKLNMYFNNNDSIKLSSLLNNFVSDSSNHDIPTSIHEQITEASVSNAVLELVTLPWSIVIKGDMHVFGNDDLNIQTTISQNPSENDEWVYTVALSFENAFSFSNVIPGASGLDEFEWEEGIIAITNAPSAIVEFGGKNITVNNGVFVEAILPMVNLSQRMEQLKLWSHVESFTFTTKWNRISSSVRFIALLPDNMPIGEDVTVDGKLVIDYEFSCSKVNVDIMANGHITLSGDLPALDASVDIEVNNSGFSLSGNVSQYTIPVGNKGVLLEDVKINISDVNGVFKGDLSANAVIGDAALSTKIIIPRPDNTQGEGVEIILKEETEGYLNVPTILSHACKSSVANGLQIPNDLSFLTENSLLNANIVIKTSPLSIKIDTEISVHGFQNQEVVDIKMEISEVDGEWGFGFGIGIDSGFHFNELMKSFEDLSDMPKFTNAVLAIAYQLKPFTYRFGELEVTAEDGIYFKGESHVHDAVTKWTGIESFVLEGSIATETHAVHLEADMNTTWKLGNLHFNQAGIFFDINEETGFDLGIDCNMMLQFKDQSQFNFDVKIELKEDITLTGRSLDKWKSPFGMSSLTIDKTELEVGFTYEMEPKIFGISGGLELGRETGSMTIFVNPSDGTFVVAGSLTQFSLGNMVDTLVPGAGDESLQSVHGIYLKDLDMDLNTGRGALEFDDKTFAPGFKFDVGEFDIFGAKGNGHVVATESGLSVTGHIDPFSFADGVVEVYGYNDLNSPSSVDITIGTGTESSHFNIECEISIENLLKAGTKIEIDDNGITADVELDIGTMSASGHLHAVTSEAGKPSDFSFSAEIDNDAIKTLHSSINGKLKDLKTDTSSHDQMTAVIREGKASIKDNNEKITAMLTEEMQKYTEEQYKLVQVQYDLVFEIASRQAYDYAHKVAMDQELEYCWRRACKTRNKMLTSYRNAVQELSDSATETINQYNSYLDYTTTVTMNPTIKELESENGATYAAIQLANENSNFPHKKEESLWDYTKDMGKAVIHAVEGELSSLFDLKRAKITATSLAGTKISGSITIEIDAEIFGFEETWSLEVDLPLSLTSIERALWDEVKNHF